MVYVQTSNLELVHLLARTVHLLLCFSAVVVCTTDMLIPEDQSFVGNFRQTIYKTHVRNPEKGKLDTTLPSRVTYVDNNASVKNDGALLLLLLFNLQVVSGMFSRNI